MAESPDSTPQTVLSTNGLLAPAHFPVAQYEAIHKQVVSMRGNHELYDQFGGAWNAVAYRFSAVIDSGATFIDSLERHGSAPSPSERYLQERCLFEFYSAGFSVFEATFYALHVIGAFVVPEAFPLASPRDQQRVTPQRVKDGIENVFAGDKIVATLENVFNDERYQRWREVRNILTHRSAPGRRIYVSVGVEEAVPADWKLNNLPLSKSLVTDALADLAYLTTELLSGIASLTHNRLTTPKANVKA